MDVVKSRIQNSPRVAGQTPKYNWAWGACGTVMKEEGFGALYKGFLPKVLRLGPVSSLRCSTHFSMLLSGQRLCRAPLGDTTYKLFDTTRLLHKIISDITLNRVAVFSLWSSQALW